MESNHVLFANVFLGQALHGGDAGCGADARCHEPETQRGGGFVDIGLGIMSFFFFFFVF